MEELKNKYLIRQNEKGRIIKAFSSAFEEVKKEDIAIGEGFGSQFRASKEVLSEDLQGFANIENGLPLLDENGIYILKYENGAISKILDEELAEEIENLPKAEKSKIQVLEEQNTELMLALTEVYEKNLSLESQLTDTQLALVEIYEKTI